MVSQLANLQSWQPAARVQHVLDEREISPSPLLPSIYFPYNTDPLLKLSFVVGKAVLRSETSVAVDFGTAHLIRVKKQQRKSSFAQHFEGGFSLDAIQLIFFKKRRSNSTKQAVHICVLSRSLFQKKKKLDFRKRWRKNFDVTRRW